MLWSAVAWLQRQHPDVIVLVYSGDYPTTSKEAIIAKVQVGRPKLQSGVSSYCGRIDSALPCRPPLSLSYLYRLVT